MQALQRSTGRTPMSEPTLSRRNVMAAGAALAAAAAVPTAEAQGAQKTFVLVHGGWHGGWCWRRVTDILERKGHKAFAPTLTGLGERSHLLNKDISTATHVADVVNLVKWERLENFCLVGHSLGGFVINDVAEEIGPKISSIVFLDGFLPDVGDSALKTASQASRDAIAKAKADGILGTKPQTAAPRAGITQGLRRTTSASRTRCRHGKPTKYRAAMT
jgi:pimeloyl-ACP methyl ester carboxylesterase